ncbi:MAG TPA: ParB/RepB/Spo0J family partition protein [Planctomicrobium sp.]|nr:ParB/RepB/Spo0J family partition protein [Planctomicrobium sp.]
MSDSSPNVPPRRLGRGLSALLGGNGPAHSETNEELTSELRQIPTNQLSPNPFQPRQQFDAEALGELASSIREHGILQPLLVREVAGSGFQVIAGERRWQAAQKAGLASVPCRVVDVIDKTACEFALEENLKRKDLSDLEKAQAFKDYLTQFECTIEELAKQLSMNRSTVNNMLRLLELSAPVKNALNAGRLTAGHARALLSLSEADQIELAGRIQAEQLTVRAVEAAVKTLLGRDTPAPKADVEPVATPVPTTVVESVQETNAPAPVTAEEQSEPAPAVAALTEEHSGVTNTVPETIPMQQPESYRTHHVDSLESQLRDMLGVKVEIHLQAKESGRIVVPFSSNEEFERVLNILRRHAA